MQEFLYFLVINMILYSKLVIILAEQNTKDDGYIYTNTQRDRTSEDHSKGARSCGINCNLTYLHVLIVINAQFNY